MGCCVAGVLAPAFVERGQAGGADRVRGRVSPGFRPRPSLSVRPERGGARARDGVAGVSAPAFVERVLSSQMIDVPDMCRRGFGPGLR